MEEIQEITIILKEAKKISEAAKKRIGILNPMYGKHHTEATKQKLREANLGKN